MSDLIERLRAVSPRFPAHHLLHEAAEALSNAEVEAADRIASLEADIAELRTGSIRFAAENARLGARVTELEVALAPFAALSVPADEKWTCGTFLIQHDDLRRAAALSSSKQKDGGE